MEYRFYLGYVGKVVKVNCPKYRACRVRREDRIGRSIGRNSEIGGIDRRSRRGRRDRECRRGRRGGVR